MEKYAFRLAFLLAVLTLVGWAGLNSSLDPSQIRKASAFHVDITVTGTGPNDSLGFSIGGSYCPTDMLPSEACTAVVTVTHVGIVALTLSAPTAVESGDLETCTGDDPANPGTGGDNLLTTFGALNYAPNSTILLPSQSVSFEVTVTLDAAATNACQGKSGEIAITIDSEANGDDGPLPPILPPDNPPPANPPAPPPPNPGVVTIIPSEPAAQPAPQIFTAEVQGAVDQPQPSANLTAEVLPSTLPKSGQGFAARADHAAGLLLLGTGLIAGGLLLFALTLSARRWSRSR